MIELEKEKELAKQIIAEIIRQAGGTLDNKTNLFKAFYHAHLHYGENQPGYLSAWPIVRMPRGPGIHNFDLLLGELMAEGTVETKEVDWAGRTGFRFRLCDTAPAPDLLPEGAIDSIAYGVQQVAGKSAEQVSKEAHEMSRAWRNAKDGEELNVYLDNIPEEEYRQRMERMRELAEDFSVWR